MAEILSSEQFDPNSSLSRVLRAEKLEGYAEFQWYMGQLRDKEKALVARCQSLDITSAERDNAVHRLAGLREAINFVKGEREAAQKHLKEEIRQEDPATPKRRPIL